MTGVRYLGLAIVLGALAGCASSLPTPDYVSVKTPAPYRMAPDGNRVDNEDYALDAQGYRIDKKGQRIGEVDVVAKMGAEPSNAMAGFYMSSTGTYAPGKVMTPSEGAAAGPGYGPGSAGMTTPAASMPAPPAAPAGAPASGAPVPLAPPTK